MPVLETAHSCNGGSHARRILATEFGIFIAPTDPDYGTGFARLSTIATTTTGTTRTTAHTTCSYTEARSFLEDTAETWARSDTYPTLNPDAVTVYVHPALIGEVNALNIVYHEAKTHHTRRNPDQDAPF